MSIGEYLFNFFLFSFDNNMEDLILFEILNFIVFQIWLHVNFLTYITCQTCVEPIVCRSQILSNRGVTFFLKTNLMIIYFTKNLDVYKCSHFKMYHVHALQCIRGKS